MFMTQLNYLSSTQNSGEARAKDLIHRTFKSIYTQSIHKQTLNYDA